MSSALSIVLFSFIVLMMLLFLAMEYPYRIPLAILVWALLVYYLRHFHRTVLRKFHAQWKLLEKEKDGEDLGHFTREEILELFEAMKRKMKAQKDIRLFTVDLFSPNAYANFFSDDVCIDKSWFRMLDTDELKALMAHELAHLRLRREQPQLYKKFLKMIYALELAVVMGIVAIAGYYEGMLLDLLILGQLLLFYNIFFLIRGFVGKGMRAEEWLCDWAGAKYVSPLAAINFELKLGQRYELNGKISKYLNRALRGYRVPLAQYRKLYKEIDRSLDREHLTPKRARRQVKQVVREMARKSRWKKARFLSWATTPERKEKDPKTHKVNWLRYDTHIKDFQLDEEELEDFITDIKADEESILFKSIIDKPTSSRGTHPSTKQRVLFLYENWKRMAKGKNGSEDDEEI